MSSVLAERVGQIAILRLNRPEKRNALNLATWRELASVFQELAGERTLRCIVLMGQGGHFAAGADIAEFRQARANTDQAETYGQIMLEALVAIRDCPHPTIAAIEGMCVGGGLELALMCDLRVAAQDAKFGIPIQKIGVTMPYPELGMLTRILGRPVMLEMLLLGELNDADWALGHEIVHRLAADPLAEAMDMARTIASGSPVSHRNHKRFTRRVLEPEPLSDEELREGYASVESADYREGIAAFLARRKPEFKGQ